MSRPETASRALAAGLCLFALMGPAATPASAADGIKSQLDAVQRDLSRHLSRHADLEQKAKQAEGEIHALKIQAVELARQTHDRSREVDALERRLSDLEKQEAKKADRLAQRRGQLTGTLAALQRIARLPTATLIAMPQPPDDTIRSAILLRAAVPELRDEARKLRGDITELARLRGDIRNQRSALDDALAELDRKRTRLASLTTKKLDLLDSTRNAERSAAQAAAKLSARAGSLRELLEKLSRQRGIGALKSADFEPPPATARRGVVETGKGGGTVPLGGLPVPGRIVTAYGDKLPNGLVSKGVSIATRPAASVVAPKAGRVVYAGNFRGYGNLVILELHDKKHALIAGLGKIDAAIGDDVLAGEPLGQMTPSTSEAPKLYFELRQGGQPINPLPRSAALKTR